MRIIIVSGLSGSGKSTAIRAFEDRGFFCVDNLPVIMIPGLIEAISKAGDVIENVVLGIDARVRTFLDDFDKVTEAVKKAGHSVEVIFLEASDEVLVRRFSETRRRHPLAGVDIRAALEQENELLSNIRNEAAEIIDSSVITVHQLKQRIFNFIDVGRDTCHLSITLFSFGFKYGVPLEADLMFDVRCLPNPYFVKELRGKTGLDREVYDYVFSFPESRQMLVQLQSFLGFSLPLFNKEGKTYLTAAVGCTGGKHRSISMVRALERYMGEKLPSYAVFVRHRDINR